MTCHVCKGEVERFSKLFLLLPALHRDTQNIFRLPFQQRASIFSFIDARIILRM